MILINFKIIKKGNPAHEALTNAGSWIYYMHPYSVLQETISMTWTTFRSHGNNFIVVLRLPFSILKLLKFKIISYQMNGEKHVPFF